MMREKMKRVRSQNTRRPLKDITTTAGVLLVTIALSIFLFFFVSKSPFNIGLCFMAGNILIAFRTTGYIYAISASVFSAVFINCFYIYPYFQIDLTLTDYPFMFVCILGISLFNSAASQSLRQQYESLLLHERQQAEIEKEKMRANLLRAVSHDLRTPLSGIIGNISAMEKDGFSYSPEECKELVHNIYDDAKWLLDMVENLLSVTKIYSYSSKIATTPEIVDEVVAEAVTRLQKRRPEANIHVEMPEEILIVPMDAMMIEQVLINLMENAVVHSQSQEPIQLIIESKADHVSFCVADQGNGLSQEQLEHAFDGTFAKAPSTDGHKGMGIGLSICHTIITAHGGLISAKNNKIGAEFLFTLPKEESHA